MVEISTISNAYKLRVCYRVLRHVQTSIFWIFLISLLTRSLVENSVAESNWAPVYWKWRVNRLPHWLTSFLIFSFFLFFSHFMNAAVDDFWHTCNVNSSSHACHEAASNVTGDNNLDLTRGGGATLLCSDVNSMRGCVYPKCTDPLSIRSTVKITDDTNWSAPGEFSSFPS